MNMKKIYLKPAMTVVKIQQQGIICTSATRQGYGTANADVDKSELNDNGEWNWD